MPTPLPSEITIQRRFRGPTDSGNGGYCCGKIAAFIEGPAEVTLRAPPPLDTPLTVTAEDDGISVTHGDTLVAQARAKPFDVSIPEPVSLKQATEAVKNYPWQLDHPYPECFVCGPNREHGDGLCIYAGSVDGRPGAAAPWVPDASLADDDGLTQPEYVWASLDCPSWFGAYVAGEKHAKVLLGRLAARIERRPRIGESCVVVGSHLGTEGRKIFASAALFDGNEQLLAVSKATWIRIDHG